MRAAVSLLALLGASACTVDETANPAHCAVDADCGSDQRCYRNLCVGPGGGMDAGPIDDGGADTGVLPTDGGPPSDGPPSCPAGREECGTECCLASEDCCRDDVEGLTCVNLQSDNRHCGTCGNACAILMCELGVCP